MSNQRRFVKNRQDPGAAAAIRENVASAMRQSAIQARPKLAEPIDYETYIVKNKVLLHNDPQREMLNFPHDDIEIPLPNPSKKIRTVASTVPKSAMKEGSAASLMVRECMKTYTDNCHTIKFRYEAYSGSYQQLPKFAKRTEPLSEHVFEIDAEEELEERDDDTFSRGMENVAIHKKGWLFKGPDGGKETIINFTRQFKRRYFTLKKQPDNTYMLEFFKDNKKNEVKGAIYLDLAQEVVKNTKRGKFCFEIRMSNRQPYVLAAENDNEADDWIITLNRVINAAETASTISRDSIKEDESLTVGKSEQLKESSINHPVVKYSRESDGSLAKARAEGRQNLFAIHPDMRINIDEMNAQEDSEIDVFPKPYCEQFILRLEEFHLKQQINIDEGGSKKQCNPEPFFISFALYDVQAGKKISEDFHIDPNDPDIKSMIPEEILLASDRLYTVAGKVTSPDLHGLKEDWIMKPKRQGLFSMMKKNFNKSCDVYLVAKIEKVLQGSVSTSVEAYLKPPDNKQGSKIHQQMKSYCSHIGHYRMPFGWSAKSLSTTHYGVLDLPIYKQETSKLSEVEILKNLQDFRKPEKQSKLQLIPGVFRIYYEQVNDEDEYNNVLTSSLDPVKPFHDPGIKPPTIEIDEFLPGKDSLCLTFDYYQNHLFVYPLNLKYDGQKSFAKARNIACCVEIRDSDAESAVPLMCIYGRPGTSVFTTVASTAVSHHSTTPDFTEEVKIALPTHLHDQHHILFRFYHVSCEASKTGNRSSSAGVKKKDNIEFPVGYAWLPLLQDGGRVNVGDQSLSVAVSLPNGYMTSGTRQDIKWVDGGKHLFKINVFLQSTIYTRDQHLHNFFQHCQRMDNSFAIADMNSLNKLKSLLAVEVSTYIQFLPTLLNQLFHLLAKTTSEDVSINAVRVLIHIISEIHEADKLELLDRYVKYVFRSEPVIKGSQQKTVHEELAKNLTSILRPANTDPLIILHFLQHAGFFFNILIKGMTQFLVDTDRVKMPRNERFSSDYQFRIQNLLQAIQPHILQKATEKSSETRRANRSLAEFVKNCFTLMDRGFVFRLVSKYIENFNPGDHKFLHEFKFEYLQIICSHEHFIPLCLPFMRKGLIKNYKDLKHDYTLSDNYRETHYLVGLMLHELKMALNQTRDIRRNAITVLRNQLAKHSFDDRYSSKSQQGRIAALYLPVITILLENKHRLMKDVATSPGVPPSTQQEKGDTPASKVDGPRKSVSQLIPAPTEIDTKRESAVFSMISGVKCYDPSQSLTEITTEYLNGSNTSLASTESDKSTSTLKKSTISPYVVRYDKLDITEIKDLLVCFLHILKFLPDDIFLGWCHSSSETDLIDFFKLLRVCLHQFRYQGRRRIFTLSMIGDSRKALTMPASRRSVANTGSLSSERTHSQYGDVMDNFHTPTNSDAEGMMRILQEANMSTEVGIIVLDLLSLFSQTFKKDLEARDGDNAIMKTVFDLHLSFLQSSQSEVLQKHVFGAWRAFIKKFQSVLFKGSASMCGEVCYSILRCCSSRLNSTRREACSLLYLLMRTNYEYTNKKNFTRVHLQVIISVSQLIGDSVGLNTSRFQESLAIVNNYANSDKGIQKSPFHVEVKDLTKRIRTVLMATAQMKENENDPELLIDLQNSLAKSYASTPELRKTWLDSMAKLHNRNGDYSECAHCYIHIAALIAEYLRQRGLYPPGCKAFRFISPNIVEEEISNKDDSGMQDVQYTEDTLVSFLEEAVEYLKKAKRYEQLGEVYKIILPIYEKKRDFKKLTKSYQTLSDAYTRVIELMESGKRLLGTYFRVAFYGQAHFEEEDGKEYIYKEPHVTALSQVCERIQKIYTDKFGPNSVKLIHDSTTVDPSTLDTKFAHLQVTHVRPYFDEKELNDRLTDFERNNNIRKFMFETPFTKGGKAQGQIDEQHKRRTILYTSNTFPYVKKRIPVCNRKEIVLQPIEVAIDEMQVKVLEIKAVVSSTIPDIIKLHLKLQGSVNPQVHSGPLAYAQNFLSPEKIRNYKDDKVATLKHVFRDFVNSCKDALDLNAKLITSEQKEYHEHLTQGFNDMVENLTKLFGEKIIQLDELGSSRLSMNLLNSAGSSTA
ncbi:hypothetical protein SNE40_021299 [Patella caerulea]|uniref:Dedicator of cytokinesis protein 9 n=1 Tax=Patella caerulea TaxID=87958 RepID=A0AAN8J0I1_PATCE